MGHPTPRTPRRGFWRAIGLVGSLAAGVGLGCVVYVSERECDGVSCGANAFCDLGTCRCFSGYEGDPDEVCDPVMSWLLTDSCDDGEEIEFRLFALERDWVWPDGGDVYFTQGLDVDSQADIVCYEGETICFGAETSGYVWGVGLDGSEDCEACCFECGSVYADMGYLTCG